MRLIDHLKEQGHSARAARELMQWGKVWFRGVPTADAAREVLPEQVEVRPNAARILVGRDPAVLWRDEHFAVVWKPAGLLSVAAPNRGVDNNLVTLMARVFGAAHPVHRLDEPTSGVMLVALTKTAQTKLKALLEAHEIERRYMAVVGGTFPKGNVTMKTRLVRDRGDGLRGSSHDPHQEGKDATTHFRLLRKLRRGSSIVEAQLETGRTHQIRIHALDCNHPVLGDQLYGKRGVAAMAHRLCLHAYVLGLVHPITGEQLRFEIPWADDLEVLIRELDSPRAPREPRPTSKPGGATKRKKKKKKKTA